MTSFNPSSLRLALIAVVVSFSLPAHAQLDIPLANIQLANASLPSVTVNLNGIFRNGRPSPFVITQESLPLNALWFCLDPSQGIYTAGSSEPAGNSLRYASTDPDDFNLWGLNAPGLSAPRVQDLADLFQAYLPLANNSLTLGALQMAVWEVANESSSNAYSLTSGFLTVTPYNGSNASPLIVTANALLASLTNPSIMNRGDTTSLAYLIDGTYRRNGSSNTAFVQDLVVYIPPVPEPSTFGLIGATLLLAVGIARKYRGSSRSGPPRAA